MFIVPGHKYSRMQFLQAILLKHQRTDSHITRPNQHVLRRQTQKRAYKGLYSELLAMQTTSHFRSESCHLNEPRQLRLTQQGFHCSTINSASPKRHKQAQKEQKMPANSETSSLKEFWTTGSTREKVIKENERVSNQDIFFSIYSNQESKGRSAAEHRSGLQQQQLVSKAFEVQANRLPIIRKKQSKRKVIAEVLKLRARVVPHTTPMRPSLQAGGAFPRSPSKKKEAEVMQICGWEDTYPFNNQ